MHTWDPLIDSGRGRPRRHAFTVEPLRIPDQLSRTCRRLRTSRLVQWLGAYLAVGWMLLEVIELLSDVWNWPIGLLQLTSLTLALGIAPAAVIAWFHGEQGRQQVCGAEALLLSMLLVLMGGVVVRLV